MNISKKILKAINEGVLNALSFDDELPDTLDITIHKVSNNDYLEQHIKELEKKHYSLKLQEMLPNAIDIIPNGIDIIHIDTYSFVTNAIEWHEKYGVTYNPHLDGEKFKKFIKACLLSLPEDMLKTANLNWIDTSEVTDMLDLFSKDFFWAGDTALTLFNGDISEWDVSNVTDMHSMFKYSRFNGNISNWDVSHVGSMTAMFKGANFNGDLSKWDISNVKYMMGMFKEAQFCNDSICNWDVSNVKSMYEMFMDSFFTWDISNWTITPGTQTGNMFDHCPIKEEYKPKGA